MEFHAWIQVTLIQQKLIKIICRWNTSLKSPVWSPKNYNLCSNTLISQKTRLWSPNYINKSHESTLRRQAAQLKKGLEQTLLQGGHTEGPGTYEKMLSIASYKRDANQNHSEIPPHTGQNGHQKQSNKWQVLERLWRIGNPSTLLVGLQTGATTMENSMELPQKTKNGTAFWPSNSTAGIIS